VLVQGGAGYHGHSRPIEGLGLIPASNAVHYDKERARRPAYHDAIAGGMPGGYAVDDGAALHFVGESLARVVSSRPVVLTMGSGCCSGASA